MHHTSHNVTNTAVLAPEVPTLKANRDTFFAALRAQSMKKYTVATTAGGDKRSCPFAAPARRQRVRHSDDDLQALQKDVEDLEAKLAAVRRRKQSQKTAHVDLNRLRNLFNDCRKQAQRDASMSFSNVASCGQLEYEPSVDAPVFRNMERTVCDQYDHLAQIFKDAGLNETKTDCNDARVVTGGQQGTFVRFTTAKVVPFSLDIINDAMWNGAKKNSMLNMETLDADFETKDNNVMYIKREYLLQDNALGGRGIPVLLRCVCRRFVEPNRIVVVWEGTGDWPHDYLRCNPSSVPIRERGYCVVQPFHRDQSITKQATPLSLFQTCVCMTPGLSADIDMNGPECLHMLSNIVIPSYRKILDAREQVLENAILDEMIYSKKGGIR